MANKPNTPKTMPISNGRPVKEIDWKIVDDLGTSGCSGAEIAPRLGIHAETLYRACIREKGESFDQYVAKLRQKGDGLLKAQQFAKAMGLTEKGDNTLLIWLGKCRLNQREYVEASENIQVKNIEAENQLMEARALLEKHGLLNELSNQPKTEQELPGSDTSI